MKIKAFISYIWELPQNLLGIVVKKIFKATPYTTYGKTVVYSWKARGGLSLGEYIFVPFENANPNAYGVQRYIAHEYGHTIQSKYLGWFYLLVIGLPSLIWCGCFNGYRAKHGISYYAFYTEKWADALVGIERMGGE